MPKSFRNFPGLAILLSALLATLGCRQPPPDAAATWPGHERLRADLRLVPSDAGIVAALDLERLRPLPIWKELAGGPLQDAALLVEGLTRGLGIDAVEQVRQLLIALPGERQDDDRLVMVLRIDRLDLARAAAWLGKGKDGKPRGRVLPPDRVVIAQGAWAAGLTPTQPLDPSALEDTELGRLCARAAGQHPLWMAATVPWRIRRDLLGQGRFPDVASLLRLRLAVDVEHDAQLELVGELSNEPDARNLAQRLASTLDLAKRHPDMLAQGLAPYLEALRIAARGPSLHATLELPIGQTAELATRMGDLLHAILPPRGSP